MFFFYRCVPKRYSFRHIKLPVALLKRRNKTTASGPHASPTSMRKLEPVVLSSEQKLEEETLPFYDERRFYPVHVGEIFHSRYKVVTKLGYGVNSTVWLCQDLE